MTPSTRIFSKIAKRCRSICGLNARRRQLEISEPFDFKAGPAFTFPGYSEDDISLMRERAIAAAITDDGLSLDFTLNSHVRSRSRSRSRPNSISGGLNEKASFYQGNRTSRSNVF